MSDCIATESVLRREAQPSAVSIDSRVYIVTSESNAPGPEEAPGG